MPRTPTPTPALTRRFFAGLAPLLLSPLLLAAPALALAQQPAFTLPQLKAFVALSPEAFRQELKRLGFSYADRTVTDEVSMIEYEKFAGDHTVHLMKSTYVARRGGEDSIQLSLTDKAAFDRLVKEARDTGYAPADKGRIPGGETYQQFKRGNDNDVVRFVYPKKVSGMGLPSYTAVVWR